MGWIASGVLAIVFLVAAAGKVADRAGARRGALELGVPVWAVPAVVVALPMTEVVVAVTLLTPWRRAAVWVAAALLALFTGIVAGALVRGQRPVCNCFGSLSARPVQGGTRL